MSASLADRGRAAVAAVEEAAFGGTTADTREDRTELHARLDAVIRGPWWRDCGPAVTVATPRETTRSSSARAAVGSGVEIRLADEQLTTATVAHELAHALAGVGHGHDDLFRAAHVDVVALMCGFDVGAALTSAYAAFGLTVGERRWPPPWRVEGDRFRVVV